MAQSTHLRARLSAMMFLEYAPWGAWLFYMGLHLQNVLKIASQDWGHYFGTFAIASLVAPWVAGQIADRWFPTERFLGISHLVGAALLLAFSLLDDPLVAYWVLLVYSIIYVPTIGLTNSLSFHHLKDPDREFGRIRVWGSIGWIFALCMDYVVLHLVEGSTPRNVFHLSAFFSLLAGVYCFTLPHTPPQKATGERKVAIWQAVKLMREPSFAVLIVVCLILTVFFSFYFNLNGLFLTAPRGVLVTAGGESIALVGSIEGEARDLPPTLAYEVEERDGAYRVSTASGEPASVQKAFAIEKAGAGEKEKRREIPLRVADDGWISFGEKVEAKTVGGMGLDEKYVGLVDALGTSTEFVTLPLLAVIIAALGIKGALLLGLAGWILRYGVFAIGQPLWFVVGSFMLHGVCFAFVYVVAQLYVNAAAQSDIRASAQSFLNAVVMGFGPFIGGYLCGYSVKWFEGNYKEVFLLALGGTLLAGLLFAFFFRRKAAPEEVRPQRGPSAPGSDRRS